MTQVRTDSLAARRQAFRAGIIADAQAASLATLGGLKPGVRVVDVALSIGARGNPLGVGDHVFVRLGLNGLVTILTWSLAVTVGGTSTAGTLSLDVLVGTTLAGAATICGAHKPTLSAQAELADQPPASDWTVQIADARWLMARVFSTAGTLEVVGLSLRCAVDSR